MPRLELGSDGMVRFDGRIIAEIAYQTSEFEDIIEAADKSFGVLDSFSFPYGPIYDYVSNIMVKAGWWKS